MSCYQSLRDFMGQLKANHDIVCINEPVSLHLEMTEIHRRVLEQRGPALLFDNVRHQDGGQATMPVLTNLFGSIERVAAGMGVKPEGLRGIGEMLAFLRQPEPPANWKDIKRLLPLARNVLAMKPHYVRSAPCQERVWRAEEVDLSYLPIQTCWPGDVSPLITWPLVVTRGPGQDKTDGYNLGIYRMQPINKRQTLMRWLKHRGGASHHAKWKNSFQEPLPVAIILGADPGTILAAVTPVPDTLSEYQFAGLLRGKKLSLVPCLTVPLHVPAEAEIIIEGHVSLTEYQPEGPFGDHTGYYNDVELFPVFTASALTMRRDPIYLSTFTSRPPDEPSILGEALNEVFIPLLQQQFPEIIDCWLPPEGCSYRMAVVSIRKQYAGQAKRVMMGIWSFLRQFLYTKWVVVVDDDINCRHWPDVIWAISTRMDPARDITIIDRTPIDYLDFASPISGLGSKIGLDATNKIGPETNRNWGEKMEMDPKIVSMVTERWHLYGINGD
jgi:4-hydroxy-3-polyprenylbenzoate decarboxylase